MKEQLVHVPEPALERCGLGGGSSGQRMGVDLRERKMPESEADIAHSLLDVFDLSKRSPRIRAFVIAVLDDQTTRRRAADVIDLVVERLYRRLTFLRHRVAG